MVNQIFPFDQDWATHETWLGTFTAKSDRWLVSYEGNFSIVCGYHSFIFLGLDSLNIGICSLTGCGPSVGVPVGKLLGYADPRNARAIESMYDAQSDINAIDGALELDAEQDGYSSGVQLYHKMLQAIPQFVNAHIPFSFEDLAGSAGGVAGAEVEVGASASMYWIDASQRLLGAPMFGPDGIANAAGGMVSASVGGLIGVWSVDRWFNLYQELGNSARAQCELENTSPAYSQPYRAIPNIHPVLQELPPPYCDLPLSTFDPMSLLPQ